MTRKHNPIDTALLLITGAVMLWALYYIFLVVPNERLMGPIQRIFYFHVASATGCYLAFGIVFVTSILFLRTKNTQFDALSVASGEVGFLFCTVVLVSGMIWGHTAWNTWFRFEPRLVTFLLLWLIYLAFVSMRLFGEPGKVAAHSAVLGILGSITVPIMVYSIKLLPAAAQLHPQVVENRGLRDPSFTTALIITTLAVTLFVIVLIRVRYRIELLNHGKHTEHLS